MARGWESKAVSDQIEEGKERPVERALDSEKSPEARIYRQQLESLRLSRSRTLEQLQRATNPAHRETLQKGLSALEAALEKVSRLLSGGTRE